MELVTQTSDLEMKLRSRAEELFAAAERAVINSPESVSKGADLAKLIRVANQRLEDERKGIVKPFNDGIKAINERFKLFTGRLQKAREILDRKILDYKRQETEKREAEAEKARAETAITLCDEFPGYEAPPPLPEVVNTISRGNLGSASVVKKLTFKLVDLSKVPLQYLALNEAAVKEAMRGSESPPEIPGVEFYEVESLSVR